MMDIMASLKVAATGLRAQTMRMRIIAENLANASSTAQGPDQQPYRRKIPTFKAELDREIGATVVHLGRTVNDKSDFIPRYDPGHPMADDKGYVKMPNVKPLVEAMDMRQAQRSYEANLNVIGAARRMLARTLDILRA